jgi:signal transduction histidine kinase
MPGAAHDDDVAKGERIALPSDSDPALLATDAVLDGRAFHLELRKRNLPMLVWTSVVFNSVYLAWAFFDYVLVPDRWPLFLVFRITAVVLNSIMVAVVLRPRFRRYSLEGFWILVVVYCSFIAPMLSLAGDDVSKYAMGLAVTMIGAGVVPVWHPRWPATALLVSGAINAAIFVSTWSGEPPMREVVANSFVVVTAIGLAVVAAVFKYDLARRDFMSRLQLATVARREAEAGRVLARTSDDLQDALERLKELDHLKSKFFANISHELRTPLTLILAPLAELADGIDDDARRRHVRVIRRNAERLLGLINDLLDLSRLDAGGLRLNLADTDIRTVAASVCENSMPAAMAAGIDLQLDCDAPTQRIWGDAHRLEIVLTNLISNSVKFTPKGGRVEVRVRDRSDGVRLEVEDTGPGIPEEDLPRVFERFFQVQPGDRRREGGVGIGLALAKELVELHGGSIRAASPGSTGTIFTILLPFGRSHIRPEVVERRRQLEEPTVRRRAEDLVVDQPHVGGMGSQEGTTTTPADGDVVDSMLFGGGRRPEILLAEDNREVRNFIRNLLAPRYEVRLAEDGVEALESIRSDLPDLLVSDVMMPRLSGTELCRTVKNDAVLRSLPVILLTAEVGSEATLDAYAHGADDFVAKPFHPRVLLARIRAQLRLRAMALHLAQQEKLAVVGLMSAGILHEVRNPVNAILNASRVLSSDRLDTDARQELIAVIGDAAVRINEITSALDTHARPAESGRTVTCDLRSGIEATLKLVRHRLDSVAIHQSYGTKRLALAPAGPMNQVILNLVDNAVRAGASTIWIGVELDGDTLLTTVADDGPGVPREVADRIFDPFFTHRPDGGGTGLGLFLSRRMVEEAGGVLRFEERSGGGALFTLELRALPLGATPTGASGGG